MKLQEASRKELRRIAKGSCICAVLSLAGFLLLDQLEIIRFSYRIVTGLVCGTAVGILNFGLLCLMVQNVTGITDQKQLRAKVQLSYNFRLAIQAGWVIIAFAAPVFNVIAAALPLVFPTAVIYYLRSTGKLMPADAPRPPRQEEPEDLPDAPGPFET